MNYTKSIKQLTECAEKNDEKKEVLPQEKGIISPAYVKNNKVKATVFRCVCFERISRGDFIALIKGINRQVVEITETKCEYFERVLFFVKPEFSAVSEGDLKERASVIAQSVGIPPATRLRKNRIRLALNMGAAAFAGAAISGGIFLAATFI